jgi:argininosuccinate synthase
MSSSSQKETPPGQHSARRSPKRIVLAYSGGLDTTFCIVWLQKERDAEVHTLTVNTGGLETGEAEAIAERAAELGATHHSVDARQELFERFVTPLIQGNVLRGHAYPLCVAAERVVQAEQLARAARELGADGVANGSTGAGNDQFRFDAVVRTLVPDLPALAPVRELGWSREQESAYLAEHGVDIPATTTTYSVNAGLWGTTIGGGTIHDPWSAVPEEAFPEAPEPPAGPSELTVGFEAGVPVSLDGAAMDGVALVEQLNARGRQHRIGRGVHIGETILGIKGRIAFEAPAPLVLIAAHRELEKLVLSRWQLYWKDHLADFYGNLLHEGLYYDPVVKDLEAFVRSSQRVVSGEARVRLERGRFEVVGVRSPLSLMNQKVATYGETTRAWSAEEATGFGKLRALSLSLAWQAGGGACGGSGGERKEAGGGGGAASRASAGAREQ